TGIADKSTRDKIEEVLTPPYQSGDRGEPIVSLKEDLVELGFANWSNPSQYYGSVTSRVVKDFQEAYKLPVDGVVGESTLAKIEEIRRGAWRQIVDTGEDAVTLKEDMVRLCFAKWSNTSPEYGKMTAGVVEDFQAYYNVQMTR